MTQDDAFNEEISIDISSEETPSSKEITVPKEDAIPDGFGLKIEEMRMLLAEKHNMQPPDVHDPLLMTVTIFNACMHEQEELHKKHKQALTAMLGECTSDYVEKVQGSVNGLAQALSLASQDGIGKLFDAHKAEMTKLKVVLTYSMLINVVSAVLFIGTLIVLQWVRP